MLDSNIILGTGEFKEYKHAIIAQNWEGWPCGAPVVYSANTNFSKYNTPVKVITLFTPSQNFPERHWCSIYTHSIKPVDVKPLCGNHKVITVNTFDPSKFDRLTEFVHDVGAISLIIEYKEGRANIPKNIHYIESMMKYSSVFKHRKLIAPPLADKDDRYVCIMTFIDLPYCMPLFNTHKVDGMGLSISGAVIAASKVQNHLIRTFRTDIVLSNFEENVFVMDGVYINTANPVSNGILRDLEKLTQLELSINPKANIFSKKLKKKKFEKNKMKSLDWSMITEPDNLNSILVDHPSSKVLGDLFDIHDPLEVAAETEEVISAPEEVVEASDEAVEILHYNFDATTTYSTKTNS